MSKQERKINKRKMRKRLERQIHYFQTKIVRLQRELACISDTREEELYSLYHPENPAPQEPRPKLKKFARPTPWDRVGGFSLKNPNISQGDLDAAGPSTTTLEAGREEFLKNCPSALRRRRSSGSLSSDTLEIDTPFLWDDI